ncbi:hypothetical protein EYF80_017450 [Liparis tanakae]|uniref:Uncharacterized protein n=1 Tax=Liparis tanakae TaxID=230148 RepID=A0A4Z2I2Y6_9TELE|nr:hypothetical protein EYF80_017450 [Liparis tanakae]
MRGDKEGRQAWIFLHRGARQLEPGANEETLSRYISNSTPQRVLLRLSFGFLEIPPRYDEGEEGFFLDKAGMKSEREIGGYKLLRRGR